MACRLNGRLTGSGTVIWLPQCMWGNCKWYEKLNGNEPQKGTTKRETSAYLFERLIPEPGWRHGGSCQKHLNVIISLLVLDKITYPCHEIPPVLRDHVTQWSLYTGLIVLSWWRHQMETFSALLALCAGNSPVTGEFPTQRAVMRSFDVFFALRLYKPLIKQSWGWWFETPSRSLWRHCNDFHFTLQLSFAT